MNSNYSNDKVFLIGFMGSGKSKLGNELSKRLNCKFIDLDQEIENQLDQNISSVFRKYGEEHFRQVEAAILDKVSNIKERTIISTGGGTPCFNKNLEKMNANGLTIFLSTPVETLAERLNEEKETRPLISDKEDEELKDYISKLLSERMRFYDQAQYKVSNNNALSLTRKIDALEQLVKNHPSI